ncbi:MAG: TIR domain-containing protein [Gammaproteobacteria bacterium]
MSSAIELNVFISYAHEDEELKDELCIHLKTFERTSLNRSWVIHLRDDRKIVPGTNWDTEIHSNLDNAQVILLLVSSDFIASDYCYGVEVARAMELHERRMARVVPIILREARWGDQTFSKLQVLPDRAVPVTASAWARPHGSNRNDAAFTNVANGLQKVFDELAAKRGDRSLARYLSMVPNRERDIPPFLPDLCNRMEQETRFDEALRIHRETDRSRRPFVFFLHGTELERHEGFLTRVRERRIPRICALESKQLSVEERPLNRPPSEAFARDHVRAFRSVVGMALLDNSNATDNDLLGYIAARASPLLLTSRFYSGDILRYKLDLLHGILRFWNGWPDIPSGCLVLHSISIKYEQSYTRGIEATNRKLRSVLKANADQGGGHPDFPLVAGLALPELPSINRTDAEDWTHLPDVSRVASIEPMAIRDLFANSDLCNALRQIPMEYLHRELHILLLKNRI